MRSVLKAIEPDDLDKKKPHAWATVAVSFKLDLIFYDVPTNKNGKMTLRKYERYLTSMSNHGS
jgi:hypothetical protein